MAKIFITTFLTLFLSFSTFADDTVKKLGQIKGGALHEMPGWFTDSFLDIEEDVADAKDNNKDVLLFFHLAGCPYCDMVLNENFRGGKNTDFIQKHFSVIAINIKGDKEVSFNGMSGFDTPADSLVFWNFYLLMHSVLLLQRNVYNCVSICFIVCVGDVVKTDMR